MSFHKRFTAEQLISYIANSYYELSYEKIRWEYDHFKKICREWLQSRPVPPPEPEQYTLPFWGPNNDDF